MKNNNYNRDKIHSKLYREDSQINKLNNKNKVNLSKLCKDRKNKRHNKRRIYKQRPISIFYYIPLILIIGIVPLIVQGKQIDLNGTLQALFWNGDVKYIDFFSCFKSIVFVLLTFLLVVNLIKLSFKKRIIIKNETKYYIPMLIYIFFAILSTTFAMDKQTALVGFVDMYQGIYVLISYIIIMFCCINMIKTIRDINIIENCFLFLIIMEGIICFTQLIGKDIFQTNLFGKFIMIFESNLDGILSFTSFKNKVYGTLFNSNYVGSFNILIFPFCLCFMFFSKSKSKKIVSMIALILNVVLIINSTSKACYLCVFLSLILIIIIFRKEMFKNIKRKIIFSILIVTSILFLIICYRVPIKNYNYYVKRLSKFYENDSNDLLIFNDIKIGKDTVELDTNKEYLKIKLTDEGVILLDRNNKILPTKRYNRDYFCVDKKEKTYLRINYIKDYPIFSVRIAWINQGIINFYKSKDGIKIISGCGRLTKPIVAKTITKNEMIGNMFSGRGYIWSRTIPLLKEHIFIGAGPDNFVYRFPQNDYVNKINNRYNVNTIIDKPHNMYLQYAMNTGVLSLLSMLIIFIIYIVQSIKLYWNMRLNTFARCFGASCFVSVVGYLAIGVINDQIISVAPLFYIILGVGISINHVYLNSKNKIVT